MTKTDNYHKDLINLVSEDGSKEISTFLDLYHRELRLNTEGGVSNSPEVIHEIHTNAFDAAIELGHYGLMMQIAYNGGLTTDKNLFFKALKNALDSENKSDSENGSRAPRTLSEIAAEINKHTLLDAKQSNFAILSDLGWHKGYVGTSVGCLYEESGLGQVFQKSFFEESHDNKLVNSIATEFGLKISDRAYKDGMADKVLKTYFVSGITNILMNSNDLNSAEKVLTGLNKRVQKVISEYIPEKKEELSSSTRFTITPDFFKNVPADLLKRKDNNIYFVRLSSPYQ